MGDLVGRRLAHFRIEAKLGEGGMGVVYRAFDEKLRRAVALKVLPEEQTAEEEARQRLLREARSAAAVTHPNLVGVFEAGEAEGCVYVAMELVEGETLRHRLHGTHLPVPEALRIAAKVAAGLERIHEAGIVHRDLKPDNVMLTRQGEVKILDFGLARGFIVDGSAVLAHRKTEAPLTAEGILVGTPGYMSPEQLDGDAIDGRSDLFSFGVMLYEMVTAMLPFRGRTNAAVVVAIANSDPEPPSEHNAEVSAELDAIVLACLAKKPGDRYAGAGGLRSDLEALIAPSDPSSPRLSYVPTRTLRPPRGRSVARNVVALGALLFAVVTMSALAMRNGGDGPGPAASGTDAQGSRHAQARSAYLAAVQALHDDNWSRAEKDLTRAVELDPGMAEAQLKLAAVLGVNSWSSVEARESFATAVTMRSQLSERDRVFMNALAPVLQESPPDHVEAAARMEAATRSYPNDADLLAWLSGLEIAVPDRALEAASRAIAIDRGDANAWEARGRALAALGRFDEAMSTLEECTTISLETTDCLYWEGAVAEAAGRCDDAERIYRRSLRRDPGLSFMYLFVAEMLFATGKPLAAVRETAAHAGPLAFSEGDRFLVAAFATTLAFATGDLATAGALARQNLAAAETTSEYAYHLRDTVELAQIALETGDVAEAARLAADFSARRESWNVSELQSGPDMTPWLLRLASPGMGDDSQLEAWADATLRSGVQRGLVWTYGFAAAARTPSEARRALSVLPRYAPLVSIEDPISGIPDGEIGHAYFLAGRFDEAAPLLERAVNHCRVVSWPYEHARAASELGQLREQRGDRAGACAAYARILKNWGSATPRSVTADYAKKRTLALGCL